MILKAFAAVLVLIGILMSGFGIYFIALGIEAQGWKTVEGQVTSVVVRVDTDLQADAVTKKRREELKRYYPSISYEWVVDGKTYSGSRYRLGETHEKYDERTDAQAAAAKFRNGAPIKVYYNVDHPNQAVLEPSLSGGVFVPLPLGLVFLFTGWALFRYREAIGKAMQQSQNSSSPGQGVGAA